MKGFPSFLIGHGTVFKKTELTSDETDLSNYHLLVIQRPIQIDRTIISSNGANADRNKTISATRRSSLYPSQN